MAEWMVRLAGSERDLRFLVRSLQDPDGQVTEEAGEFRLRSRLFEGLARAGEVKRVADEIVDGANLMALLRFERYRGVRTAGVVRVDPDGSQFVTIGASDDARIGVSEHVTISASGAALSGAATAIGFATVVGSQPAPPPDLLRDMAVLKGQPDLADALRYVRNEPNWYGYYKAYEAVRDANGGDRGLKRKGWTTEKMRGRFTHSAQPDRHHDYPGPDDRMSEAEGRDFVLHLLRQWRDEELLESP